MKPASGTSVHCPPLSWNREFSIFQLIVLQFTIHEIVIIYQSTVKCVTIAPVVSVVLYLYLYSYSYLHYVVTYLRSNFFPGKRDFPFPSTTDKLVSSFGRTRCVLSRSFKTILAGNEGGALLFDPAAFSPHKR